MRLVETFLKNIFSEIVILREKEDDKSFEVEYSAKSLSPVELDVIKNSGSVI